MEEEQKQYKRKWNCLFFYWMKGGLVYNPRKKSSDFMAKTERNFRHEIRYDICTLISVD